MEHLYVRQFKDLGKTMQQESIKSTIIFGDGFYILLNILFDTVENNLA